MTVEEWQDGGGDWVGHAYGGPIEAPVDLTVTGETQAEERDEFVRQWNERAGSSWSPDEFEFVASEGRR